MLNSAGCATLHTSSASYLYHLSSQFSVYHYLFYIPQSDVYQGINGNISLDRRRKPSSDGPGSLSGYESVTYDTVHADADGSKHSSKHLILNSNSFATIEPMAIQKVNTANRNGTLESADGDIKKTVSVLPVRIL